MIREIVLDDGGMNLLSSRMLQWLREQFVRLPDCRVVVLRSARPNIFAAGADMAEMQCFTPSEAEAFSRLGQETFDAIERLPMITVAVIDGDCFGGALDLALAFDLRFATPRARFSHPGARLGIVTGFGGTSRWRKVLDRAAARRLFLGNEVVGAGEALRIGLIDRIGDPDLDRMASLDPGVVRMIKELSRHAERLSDRELMLLGERLGHLYFER